MENKTVSLTPKAIIFMSLGGYTANAAGSGGLEKSEKIQNELAEYMQQRNLAVISENGKLEFVEINIRENKETWYSQFKFW